MWTNEWKLEIDINESQIKRKHFLKENPDRPESDSRLIY